MYKNPIIQADLKVLTSDYNYDLSVLKNKTVLITGVTGMLATYYMFTLMYLNDNFGYNVKIYALVRNIEKLKKKIGKLEERKDVIPVIQDIAEEINIEDDFDFVLHAAGAADPHSLSTFPFDVVKIGMLGAKNTIEFAVKKHAKYIFTSTREVYGEVDTATISEETVGKLDQTEVRSCYPETKRLSENMIICAAEQFGLDYTITRLAHAYGPGMQIRDDGRIMADLICAAVDEKDIVLKSAGEQKRAFCYISDAVAGLLFATISDEKILNISNETEETTIIDLANKIAKSYSLKVVIKAEENKNSYVKFKRVALDNTKLMNLGWKPIYSLEDGIKKTVDYTKECEK